MQWKQIDKFAHAGLQSQMKPVEDITALHTPIGLSKIRHIQLSLKIKLLELKYVKAK